MEPLIVAMLDTDYYKLTMGQLVFRKHPDIPVKYALINRTKSVNIADVVAERDLRSQLDHFRTLRFTDDELHYLAGLVLQGERVFGEDYLDFLRTLTLPPYDLHREGGRYRLEFTGRWSEAIYWEIPALAMVNELYYRALTGGRVPESAEKTGQERLAAKIGLLRENPSIRFADFGTRRRFSRRWQEAVLRKLQEALPGQFIGTSNVDLARRLDMAPVGTFAHEMYMVLSGIRCRDDDIRQSHGDVLKEWWGMYGAGLSIALTDTYGSDFFFRDFTPEQAAAWKGLRQDSGDPVTFGEKAIAFYRDLGIDPAGKTVVFSDGLTVEEILKLQGRFSGRIGTAFGWGTNLTNDLGYGALSLIIKATQANGRGTVKLSDNPAKALGREGDIARFREIFGYRGGDYQECRY